MKIDDSFKTLSLGNVPSSLHLWTFTWPSDCKKMCVLVQVQVHADTRIHIFIDQMEKEERDACQEVMLYLKSIRQTMIPVVCLSRRTSLKRRVAFSNVTQSVFGDCLGLNRQVEFGLG